MANLGYIGLGAMGGRIADRLLSGPWSELEKEDCAVLFHVLAKRSGVPA